MNFLPDVYVPCEVCHGARYNRETLEVHYKGKTIAEVLDMPIEEALEFFEAVPAIHRHMRTLVDVGLGYVRLGQPAPTLSGGEAQRVKLSTELQKRSTGRTVYVLDEPTTGLHFEDIRKLLLVLGRLVDQGNTVLVIEHNLDVIKTADWIVDMGPEGGNRGGLVVAEGTPEEVADDPDSHTGAFLKPLLEGRLRTPRRADEEGRGEEGARHAARRRRLPPRRPRRTKAATKKPAARDVPAEWRRARRYYDHRAGAPTGFSHARPDRVARMTDVSAQAARRSSCSSRGAAPRCARSSASRPAARGLQRRLRRPSSGASSGTTSGGGEQLLGRLRR